MKRWWTVIRIAQRGRDPIIIVKKAKMGKKGITQFLKNYCNKSEKLSKNVLATAYRYVYSEEKPTF